MVPEFLWCQQACQHDKILKRKKKVFVYLTGHAIAVNLSTKGPDYFFDAERPG